MTHYKDLLDDLDLWKNSESEIASIERRACFRRFVDNASLAELEPLKQAYFAKRRRELEGELSRLSRNKKELREEIKEAFEWDYYHDRVTVGEVGE